MGSPERPTQAQVRRLAAASRLGAEAVTVTDGALDLDLPRQGVALVELR
jgi:hypothetical protein